MLNFINKNISYKVVSDYFRYALPPKTQNQTLVTKSDGSPYYDESLVNIVKDTVPSIQEYHNVRIYNEKNNSAEIFKKNNKVQPTFISNHTTSYHHFLIDMVGKILHIQNSGIRNLDIKIIIKLDHFESKESFIQREVKSFHKEIFYWLGLPEYESCLVDIGSEDSLFFDKVIVADSTTGNMDNFVFTLNLIREKFVKEYSYTNKIYVSRKNAITEDDNGRRVNDEHILQEYYINNGYKVVFFEELSFRDQVDLVSSCSDIVTYNGSSMVNTLFSPEQSNIIEIRNSEKQQHDAYRFWSQWFNKNHKIIKCFGVKSSLEIIKHIENSSKIF
jgi:hypothetical protein